MIKFLRVLGLPPCLSLRLTGPVLTTLGCCCPEAGWLHLCWNLLRGDSFRRPALGRADEIAQPTRSKSYASFFILKIEVPIFSLNRLHFLTLSQCYFWFPKVLTSQFPWLALMLDSRGRGAVAGNQRTGRGTACLSGSPSLRSGRFLPS